MPTPHFTPDAAAATNDRGCWSIPVPWAIADLVRDHLARRGLACVLCLDPVAQAARLELPPGAELGPVIAAFAQ